MYGGVTRLKSKVGILDAYLEKLVAEQKCSITEIINIMSCNEVPKIYDKICEICPEMD